MRGRLAGSQHRQVAEIETGSVFQDEPGFALVAAKDPDMAPSEHLAGVAVDLQSGGLVDPEGQHAVTEYRVLGAHDGRAWLELRPRTGRTHQVRVHCAVLGCPVVGDVAYGGPGEVPPQLHAREIALPLYPAKPPIRVTAPVPQRMLAALTRLGYDPDEDKAWTTGAAAQETIPA